MVENNAMCKALVFLVGSGSWHTDHSNHNTHRTYITSSSRFAFSVTEVQYHIVALTSVEKNLHLPALWPQLAPPEGEGGATWGIMNMNFYHPWSSC
jgi:hypothetical protein